MIGKMRHKITVMRTDVGDDFGFSAPDVTTPVRFTIWAKIDEISRKDAIRQGLDVEVSQYKVVIRSAIGSKVITKNDKVQWNGGEYNVRTSPKLLNLENREFYEFIITRGK